MSGLDDELSQSRVVRLRGLPFTATEDDIKAFFNGLDIGPDGVVIQLNFQGRSTGQAFVQFADVENANKALEKNRQHIGSRYIEVFKGHAADMESALRMLGRGSAGGGTGGGAAGAGAGGAHLLSSAGAAAGAGAGAGVPGSGGSTDMRYAGVLRMRGMPYSATVADVTAFFKGMGIVQDGIFILSHPDGRPSGEAFVEFVDEETASRAMSLHREQMGSRYVELFRSTKGEMMAALNHRMYGMFGVGGGMPAAYINPAMGGYASMAAPSAYAAMPLGAVAQAVSSGSSLASPPSDNVCIKMRGLPFSASHADILEFFRGYGVVDNGIHVVLGPGDRPSGEAYVEFSGPEEAARAMEKHRQHMGARYVELFRVTKSEALIAVQGASMANFNMAAAMDPNMQLLLLQQQQLQAAAALGMGGASGTMPGAGAWGRPQ